MPPVRSGRRRVVAVACAIAWLAGCSGGESDQRTDDPPFAPSAAAGASGGTPPPAGTAGASAPPGNEGMGGLPLQPGQGSSEPPTLSRVLVFSRTLSYRHDSIGPGINALRQLGTDNGFELDASEDPATFADATLSDY